MSKKCLRFLMYSNNNLWVKEEQNGQSFSGINTNTLAPYPITVSLNLANRLLCQWPYFSKPAVWGLVRAFRLLIRGPIKVCKNKRIKRNRVFRETAAVGESTVGWFYGFKLHIVINDKGEVLNSAITQANVDDRDPLKNEAFLKNIFGKLFGDKGYISKELFKILFTGGVHLVTGIRNNMKNSLMTLNDKIVLRKRSVIETVKDELKNICQVEHSRHRSFCNFIVNLLAGVIA